MESAAMDLDLSIIDTVPHAWPLYAGKFGDASWTIEFQRSPTSVLRRTLSGVTWRWPRTSEWFQCVPDQMEAAVISEASKLGAGEDLRVIMTTSANHFAQWEILAMKADETNAVDFGLASLPVSPEPSASGLKYNTKFSGAFHQAMAGIFILDTMFWLLDDHPQRSNLPKPHPLYSLNSVPPEFHSKHLGRVCHRLSRWEDHVIASTHLVDQKHSPQTPDVANLRISEALKVLSATPSSWRWGKVLRNMATVAMGLRMFHQPEEFSTLSAESKVETHRALLLACGISPILVLFPELLTTKQLVAIWPATLGGPWR
ncbi:hypothetical protein BS47DRAFT_534733 [Hydnum rufescens UP504]|uniref:Uncharacterized protein n=1 Tax=Hydnum rufescens UP504 TaxID=1448309 RepID=A0A9P6AIJ9_9AGAM|nr:hypothetical protein BS47DRAFT_534733 [Hydnum rufescens UP504]